MIKPADLGDDELAAAIVLVADEIRALTEVHGHAWVAQDHHMLKLTAEKQVALGERLYALQTERSRRISVLTSSLSPTSTSAHND